MNILIVGNGFDLSHYLPTKYDHFMVAMSAIENWEDAGKEMSFDDLFGKDYWHKNDKTGEEKQNKFFQNTKAIYKTEEIKISVDEIKELKTQLKENCWYQYFKNHVEEIKTWIDFENKIEHVLMILARFIIEISSFHDPEVINKYLNNVNKNGFNIRKSDLRVLNFFNLILSKPAIQPFSLNNVYYYGEDIKNGFNALDLIKDIYDDLEKFIGIFNFYIETVVKKLTPKNIFKPLKSDDYDLTEIAHIYSFNYTQTYLDFYNSKTEIDFLHGMSGQKQNMVLGVSDLKDKALKKIKAYGFTKYHQKLMKDTDYLFLNEFKSKVKSFKNDLIRFDKNYGHHSEDIYQDILIKKFELNLKFYIWGHSLDVSDQEYIIDLFSLNDDIDRNVRVIVYYFDNNAKFSLLANLLYILGKKKVERWMKQDWLKFEPNPDIAQLNQIQPVELPKST
ncbi:hypothetical protein E0H77_08975 [Acinetobacter sp. ANC 4633]|uniref:AbiH family protein n=1 Tax=Acinetobacter sp. ANC 4633 TaxID=2529845 RepID=UPI001038F122|nr:AbiH family protein [Acinetobacter sp. ANC 4633]TCB25204.1 hypothetical protein E0H77_08975 [Acinetobacter sp. ANC 4633]